MCAQRPSATNEPPPPQPSLLCKGVARGGGVFGEDRVDGAHGGELGLPVHPENLGGPDDWTGRGNRTKLIWKPIVIRALLPGLLSGVKAVVYILTHESRPYCPIRLGVLCF